MNDTPNVLKKLIASEFHDEEARRQYAHDMLDAFIALQIKTLRQQRGLTRRDLADLAAVETSRVSAMERIDHQKWDISILRRIAEALDLALVLRFESFGQFLNEVSALDRASLERPSFSEDPAFNEPASSDERNPTHLRGARILDFPSCDAAATQTTEAHPVLPNDSGVIYG